MGAINKNRSRVPGHTRVRIPVAVTAACLLLATAGEVEAQSCAQPVTGGSTPTASDCLFILQAAVGSQLCEPECLCAPTGALPITASDALLCLKKAVGQDVTLSCPCPTTTTLPPTTTTTVAPATTTTSPPLTTTTIPGDPIARGRAIYDERCAFCHAAGSHDPVGEFASDLAGKGDALVPDLGTLDDSMSGMMLTDREIADLAAFLDSL